jgi:hypothetical protein
MALNTASASTNFTELSYREKLAAEFGRTYLTNMVGAPPEAVKEMESAIAAMERAVSHLDKSARDPALPPEEEALARLYQVLALIPELKSIPIPKIPPPPPPPPQEPQLVVSLKEIKKPAPPQEQADPEIEQALEEARDLREEQQELNELGKKLASAQRPTATPKTNQEENLTLPNEPLAKANSEGEGKGEGEGEGEGQGQGKGKGQGQKPKSDPPKAPSTNPKKPNEGASSPQLAGASNETEEADHDDQAENAEAKQNENPNVSEEKQLAKNELPRPVLRKPPGTAQLKKAPPKTSKATAATKGKGKGKGKARGSGQRGKGKGQGTQPGDGSGQPSNQPKEPPQAIGANEKQEGEPEMQTAEELAELEQELSQEAKELVEMLERLAGKGRRVGHNVAVSANKAAEHMEGAAEALKQGNAAGAGMRGTMSMAELDKVVNELERLVAPRPDLKDVAAEEAPKEYEPFISEYFRKLSYEK